MIKAVLYTSRRSSYTANLSFFSFPLIRVQLFLKRSELLFGKFSFKFFITAQTYYINFSLTEVKLWSKWFSDDFEFNLLILSFFVMRELHKLGFYYRNCQFGQFFQF